MVARNENLHQADEFDEIFNLPTVDIPSPIPATPSVNIPEVFNFEVPLPTEPLPSPANLFISDSDDSDDISDILAKINQPVLSEDSSDEEEFNADQVANELFSSTRRQVSFSNNVQVIELPCEDRVSQSPHILPLAKSIQELLDNDLFLSSDSEDDSVDVPPKVYIGARPVTRAQNSVGEIFPFNDSLYSRESPLALPRFHEDVFEPSHERFKLKYINVKTTRTRYNRKFQAHKNDYKIILKNNTGKTDKDLISLALEEMLAFAKHNTNFQEGDRINIVVLYPRFFYPISTGFESKDHIK